jgi:hypothetical protein
VPFDHHGPGWEVAHAALFLISSESSYASAHTLFLDGGHPAGSCAASLQKPNSSRHCRGDNNTHLFLTCNFFGIIAK